MSPEIAAYSELVGAHPCKMWRAHEFEWVVRTYGAMFGLHLLTGFPVDETMHALDRARGKELMPA